MNPGGCLLVISPHLDDAVLSCGLLLAAHPGAVVCTIFTAPPDVNISTDWDRDSGFADAFEAMRVRKREDASALRTLGAVPIHLPFRDAQYLASPSHEALVAALKRTVSEVAPAIVAIPCGLFHSDHTRVADACLALLNWMEHLTVVAYEEVPYRHIPGVLQERLRALLERGFAAEPTDLTTLEKDARNRALKLAALDTYQSQLRAFGPAGRAGLDSPERYWRIRAPERSDDRHI